MEKGFCFMIDALAMPVSPESLRAQKQALSHIMLQRRREAWQQNPEAPLELRDLFLKALTLPVSSAVALTVAQKDEIDPLPLALSLAAMGHKLCLPCVIDKDQPLTFRLWQPGDVLAPGPLAIPEPLPEAPVIEPEVLLIPLLAFDRNGNRLGQGGGYYDRTLAQLRAGHKILAIGLGFAAQEMPSIPSGPNDASLDIVVTEREFIRPTGC